MDWYANMHKSLAGFQPPSDLTEKDHVELEGRIGTFSSSSGFTPGIPTKMLDLLTQGLDLAWQPLNDVYYDNGCRRRNLAGSATRKRYIHCVTIRHPDSQFAFRVALAVETQVPVPSSSSGVSSTRTRMRASVTKPCGKWRYDFSVDDKQHGEAEVEWTGGGGGFTTNNVMDLACRMAHMIRGLLPQPIPRPITLPDNKTATWPIKCLVSL